MLIHSTSITEREQTIC